MQLYTNKFHTESDLQAIAPEGIDVQVSNISEPRIRGKRKGQREFRFVLRPEYNEAGNAYRLVRTDFSGRPRKVFAVSWQAHWDFMVRLFDIDPDAEIVSAAGHYLGSEGFRQTAPETRHKNIGSTMYPLYYSEATVELLGQDALAEDLSYNR